MQQFRRELHRGAAQPRELYARLSAGDQHRFRMKWLERRSFDFVFDEETDSEDGAPKAKRKGLKTEPPNI